MPDVQKIAFNCSLPRSGSTLLQNIFAQNPRFYCSPTSGLYNLLITARTVYSNAQTFKAQDRSVMRAAFRQFCARGMQGFYEGITGKPVCLDKSRGWLHFYEWLADFHPSPKMIICVRDLRSILSSMEKLFRKNRDLEDPSDTNDRPQMVTITNRAAHWLAVGPLGPPFLHLIEAMQTGTIKNCHIVRFEDLTTNPAATMRRAYAYLEEPYFEHDFEKVEQLTVEDDSQFMFYGDHNIRAKIAPVPLDYNEVLGRDVAQRVKDQNPIFYRAFYPETIR